MRLLYVSRSAGIHDRRFVEGWRRVGVTVEQLAVPGEGGEAVVAAAVERSAFDLVQVGPLTEPGLAVARAWPGPLIATSWGFDLMHEIADPRSEAAAREVLARADLVIVDNDATERRSVALGADPDAVVQFPWGLDAHWLALPPRTASTPPRIFLVARRHEPTYRVEDALRAFLAATETRPGIELRIAGSGSLTPRLRAIAAASPHGGRIVFLGDVDPSALPALYGDADAYVTSSAVDGSSVSLLEAMASSLPVIASDIEGNAQWATAETSATFAVGDVDALAALIGRFADADPAELAAIDRRVAAARAAVRERADWEGTLATFLALARRAIERRSSR